MKQLTKNALFFMLITGTFMAGCQQDKQHNPSAQVSNASAAANPENAAQEKKQATQILDFPVYVDKKVPTLLHPIMPNILTDDSGSYAISKSKGVKNFGFFEATSPFFYHTYINNLVFENIATGDTQKLFQHHQFIIREVYYPHVITEDKTAAKAEQQRQEQNPADASIEIPAKKQKKTLFNHIIFHVQEQLKPKNDDKKSNIYEQQALYMTDIYGKNRSKLHPDNEYVVQTKWLPEVARYYFITQTDSDNNGIINHKDARKNYVIDFKKENPLAVAYEFEG